MAKELVEAIADMREDDALEIIDSMLDQDTDPASILADCQQAMAVVGQRYESGEYFLPELIMSGEMLRKVSDLVKPRMATESSNGHRLGKFVLGTVRGDIHDIGKDIVAFMLDVNGFEVHDLGVDVSEERFVKAVREIRPQVVGLSGFLTLAYDSMKSTVEALKDAGLREDIKIVIGGGQITEMVREYTGADAYGQDAMAAVNLSRQWLGLGVK